MEKEIGVGSLVKHKVLLSPRMVVISKVTEHGYIKYECRWWNVKSGTFECEEFYNSELEMQRKT